MDLSKFAPHVVAAFHKFAECRAKDAYEQGRAAGREEVMAGLNALRAFLPPGGFPATSQTQLPPLTAVAAPVMLSQPTGTVSVSDTGSDDFDLDGLIDELVGENDPQVRQLILAMAMSALTEAYQAQGKDPTPVLKKLREMANNGAVQAATGGDEVWLAWTAAQTKGGKVKAVGTDEHQGRTLYGKQAESALRSQEKRGKQTEARARRDDLVAKIDSGELFAEQDWEDFSGHLESLTGAELKDLRGKIKTALQDKMSRGVLKAGQKKSDRVANLQSGVKNLIQHAIEQAELPDPSREKGKISNLIASMGGIRPDDASFQRLTGFSVREAVANGIIPRSAVKRDGKRFSDLAVAMKEGGHIYADDERDGSAGDYDRALAEALLDGKTTSNTDVYNPGEVFERELARKSVRDRLVLARLRRDDPEEYARQRAEILGEAEAESDPVAGEDYPADWDEVGQPAAAQDERPDEYEDYLADGGESVVKPWSEVSENLGMTPDQAEKFDVAMGGLSDILDQLDADPEKKEQFWSMFSQVAQSQDSETEETVDEPIPEPEPVAEAQAEPEPVAEKPVDEMTKEQQEAELAKYMADPNFGMDAGELPGDKERKKKKKRPAQASATETKPAVQPVADRGVVGVLTDAHRDADGRGVGQATKTLFNNAVAGMSGEDLRRLATGMGIDPDPERFTSDDSLRMELRGRFGKKVYSDQAPTSETPPAPAKSANQPPADPVPARPQVETPTPAATDDGRMTDEEEAEFQREMAELRRQRLGDLKTRHEQLLKQDTVDLDAEDDLKDPTIKSAQEKKSAAQDNDLDGIDPNTPISQVEAAIRGKRVEKLAANVESGKGVGGEELPKEDKGELVAKAKQNAREKAAYNRMARDTYSAMSEMFAKEGQVELTGEDGEPIFLTPNKVRFNDAEGFETLEVLKTVRKKKEVEKKDEDGKVRKETVYEPTKVWQAIPFSALNQYADDLGVEIQDPSDPQWDIEERRADVAETLTPEEELRDTDSPEALATDAAAVAKKGEAGRPPLANNASAPFASRLAKGKSGPASAAAKAVKSFKKRGEVPPVPKVVRDAFKNAPDKDKLDSLWKTHIEQLAGEGGAAKKGDAPAGQTGADSEQATTPLKFDPKGSPKHPDSEFEVVNDNAGATASRLLGRNYNPRDLAAAANGIDGLKIHVMESDGGRALHLSSSPYLGDTFKTAGVNVSRKIYRDGSGQLVCSNEVFDVRKHLDHKPMIGGEPVRGADMLANQVAALKKLGVSKIKTLAARSAGDPQSGTEGLVGYKVWPKLGYDGPLPTAVRRRLPPALRSAVESGGNRLSALYAADGGREWWEENGRSIPLSFDTADDSYSMRTLSAYLSNRDSRSEQSTPEASNAKPA